MVQLASMALGIALGIGFLVIGSQALTEDGGVLTGANVCTYRRWESGYFEQNVTYSCWQYRSYPCYGGRRTCQRRVRDTCWRLETVCDQRWVTYEYCCPGTEENGRGGCQVSIECSENNGGCEHICRSDGGSHTCQCFEGYTLQGRTKCVDIDECEAGTHDCQHQCENTDGRYYCTCQNGYKLTSPTECEDIDECAYGNGGCQHDCFNTVPAFYCECQAGYRRREGFFCDDIDECAVNNGDCPADATCVNMEGKFMCACPPNRRMNDDNTTCVVVESCAEGNGGCSHQCAMATDGTVTCLCPHEGYDLQEGKICVLLPGEIPASGVDEPLRSEPASEARRAPTAAIVGGVIGAAALVALAVGGLLLAKHFGVCCFAPVFLALGPLAAVVGKKKYLAEEKPKTNEYVVKGAIEDPYAIGDDPPAYEEVAAGGLASAFRNHTYDLEAPITGVSGKRALLPPKPRVVEDDSLAYENVVYNEIGEAVPATTKPDPKYEEPTTNVTTATQDDDDVYDECFNPPSKPAPRPPSKVKPRKASTEGAPPLNDILNARNLLKKVDA